MTNDWHESAELVALPEEGNRVKPGYLVGHRFGLQTFPAGTYPSCSRHGAMLKVSIETDWWRCAEPGCNIGCEWTRRQE